MKVNFARLERIIQVVLDQRPVSGYLSITEGDGLVLGQLVGEKLPKDHCLLAHQATLFGRFLSQFRSVGSSLEARDALADVKMRGGAVRTGKDNIIVSFSSSLLRARVPDEHELWDEAVAVAIADGLWGAYASHIAGAFAARELKGCKNPHVISLLDTLRIPQGA